MLRANRVLFAASFLFLPGCSLIVSSVDDFTFGDDDGGMDASTSDGGTADGGADAGMDDAGPATCERPLDCDDGVFCNGAERCDPSDPMADVLGCLPPEGDRCLPTQTCDEEMNACLTMCDVESDADGDGVDAMECGGTDCDDSDDDRFPGRDRRYASLSPGELPLTESLKLTVDRFLPYWDGTIAPAIRSGKRVLIAAHGNSLRALVKHLDGVSEEDIVGLNIPTGVPLVYELDKHLKPTDKRYLGDQDAIKQAMHAVAKQGASEA